MPHNGGRVQICVAGLQTGGEFPFIDHMKHAQAWLQTTDSTPPTPSNLDASTGLPVSGSGVYTVLYLPSQTAKPGDWIVDWKGNMTNLRHGFGSTTTGGATSGVDGFWKFTPTDAVQSNGQIRLDIGINSWGAGNPITQLRVYHESNAALLASGEVFNPDFIVKLQAVNPGVIRFLDWVSGNSSMVPNWNYRKPLNYAYYNNDHYIPSRDAGSAGGTSSALTCNYPNSETLVDKMVLHLRATNGATSGSTLNSIPLKKADGTSNFTISSGRLITAVYDLDLNVWVCNDGGLPSGVPYEMQVALCNKIGAHCWTHIPYLALDNPASLTTPLAQYLRDNLAAGLTGIFEPNNEIWNNFSGFPGTNYGSAKSAVLFPSQNIHDWVGMVGAINGKAVSDVYSADRSRYEFMCGVQSATFNSVSGSDRRLESTQWVALGGGRTAAKNWVTAINVTSYINAITSGTWPSTSNGRMSRELELAFEWQTATEARRQQLIADYWSNNTAENTSPLPSIDSLPVSYQTWLAWAQSKGVNKMFAYEGGNSQDYPSNLTDDNCAITNIQSVGATTVVTLNSSAIHPPNNNSNVWAAFASVGGMTGINAKVGKILSISGDTVTVDLDSSGFGTYTSGGNLRPYLALPITNITKASNAVITTDGSVGNVPTGGFFCYVAGVAGMTEINGLNAAVTRTTLTVGSININSSGFSTYTSGGFLLVPSVGVRRDFRAYCKSYYRLYDIEVKNMKSFIAAGGKNPSLFHLGGTAEAWAPFQPTIYDTPTPKWDAFRMFGTRKRRIRW